MVGTVGVLALQGAFQSHCDVLESIQVDYKLVTQPSDFKSIKGLMKKCRIQFIHVSAHQEEPKNRYKYPEKYELWYGNYMADKLAKKGIIY